VRWTVEECFAQANAELGLDQYEVRRWDAWHRYVTLCLLAHAFLVVTRLAVRREEEGAGKKGCRDRPVPAHGAGFPPTVLGGILWVASTGSSWWEIPEEFGKWETAYRRYRLWIE
jgi:hypothetical protein